MVKSKKILLSILSFVVIITSFALTAFADFDVDIAFLPVYVQSTDASQADWNYGIDQYTNSFDWHVYRKGQGALTTEFVYATNDAQAPLRRGQFYLHTTVNKRVVLSFGTGEWYTGQILVNSDWVGNTIRVVNENGIVSIEVYKARSLTQYYESLVKTTLSPEQYEFDQYGMILLSMYYTINLDTKMYNLYLNTATGVEQLFSWELHSINPDRVRVGMFDEYQDQGQPSISIESFSYGWVDDGYNDGYQEGYRQGSYEGYLAGKEDGLDKGFQEGFDEGYERGKQSVSGGSGSVDGDDIDFPAIFNGIFGALGDLWNKIFNYEILGINVSGIMGGIILLSLGALVFYWIRKFRG